ncbi:MAG TPA: PIN domain-containing protein [Candidatus Sulfotelmatobacter sp.]|nr:PIN domain-containing protein [Candidatus Sulfotelmatobacter sp.]
MTRAVLADTGPLYAANDEGDTHHQRALHDLKELTRDHRELLIPYPILLEAYSLLLYRLGRNAASSWLAEVADASFVSPTPEDYGRGVATVRTLADQRITLVDATIAALAVRMKLEVWTYDHAFDVMRVPVWRG